MRGEIYYDAKRKQFCPKGHDTHVVGRYRTSRSCVKCITDVDNRERLYGISAEVWNQMVKDQDGFCAICREKEAVVVDHDHASGRVRGALCQICNRGLGHFNDSSDVLASAADYLRKAGK